MNMNEYYSYRKAIRDLYSNDNSNGLCSRLLEIRDKNKSVSTMTIDIPNYQVDVEFEDDTNDTTKNKVIDKIISRIGSYILDNSASISTTNKSEFDKFMCHGSNYCDVIVVGNSLKINL